MKALGVKVGFPDLILPVAKGTLFVGLIIEMKSDTGRTTPEQDEWLAHFKSQGWLTVVARSAAAARHSARVGATGGAPWRVTRCLLNRAC